MAILTKGLNEGPRFSETSEGTVTSSTGDFHYIGIYIYVASYSTIEDFHTFNIYPRLGESDNGWRIDEF